MREDEKVVQLRPIKETSHDYEALERRLKELFRKLIYEPLVKEFDVNKTVLANAYGDNALIDAIKSGRITYYRGTFSGRLNAAISKQLRDLGASWDRKTGTFKAQLASLPVEVRTAVYESEGRFAKKLAAVDKKLAQILPEEIADRFKATDIFDRTLYKTDTQFQASVRGITVAPQLTPERRKKIADEWQNNMQLYIKDFTEKEIKELRTKMQKTVFAGNRYESAIETIQESYGVSTRKAKFLARQETSLLMTKFKESRYQDAGVNEYRWVAVAGTKLHPTRPAHKALADQSKKGKIYRWDQPPNTAEPGEPARYNNPGQDYNCRCTAIPIVRFK